VAFELVAIAVVGMVLDHQPASPRQITLYKISARDAIVEWNVDERGTDVNGCVTGVNECGTDMDERGADMDADDV
jgi:hypothetical protein